MQKLILREDLSLLLLLGLFLVSLASANTFLQISGDSLFISHLGVSKMPLMYIISALVLVIIALTLIPVIDRMERHKIYNITAASLAFSLISCRLISALNFKWIYYVVYIITYILEAVLFLEFWLMASDVCHTRQARRIFPLILGASLASGIAAAFLAKTLSRSIETENILLISAGLCGLTIIFSQLLSKLFSQSQKAAHLPKELSTLKRLHLDLKVVWESNLVRVISFSFICYTVLSFILEYKFNQASSLHFTVSGEVMTDELTAFFGQVKGSIAIAAIALQFLFSRKLINTFGVCRTYLIMPFIFLFGFFGLSIPLLPFFYVALFSRFAHKTVYGSWYRSSSELLYNAISTEKRGRVRAFHTTVVEPLGVAFAGGVLILAQNFSLILAIVLSLVYIAIVAFKLKKNYLAGLLNMLKQKSGGLRDSMSGFFGRYGTREIVDQLSRALEDTDPNVRTFVCETLSDMKGKDILPVLASHYSKEKDSHIKARILKILGERRDRHSLPIFEKALKERDANLRKYAIFALGEINDKETLKTIAPFLDDEDFTAQAQAIVTSWNRGADRKNLEERIKHIFENEKMDARLAAIEIAGSIPIPESLNYLQQILLKSPLYRHCEESKMRSNLEKAVIKALGKTHKKESAEFLIKFLEQRDRSLSFLISTTLASMDKTALDPVKQALNNADTYTRYFLLNALEHMAGSGIKAQNILGEEILKELVSRDIKDTYYKKFLIAKLKKFKNKNATFLIEDSLLEESNKAQSNAMASLRLLDDNSERMHIISKNILHPDTFIRSNALEALENVSDPELVAPLISLLEEMGLEDDKAQWPKKFDFSDLTTNEALKTLLNSSHRWLRATTIFAIGELKLTKFKESLIEFSKDNDRLIRTTASEALVKISTSSHNLLCQD